MKPTKMRNNQIYHASIKTRSKQLGSPLSKELRQKYGRRSVRVIKGDTVKVTRGEFKDVDGKVSRVSTLSNSIAIEGIKKEKPQGDKFDVLIHSSNVIVTALNTDDSWRMAKIEGKKSKIVKKQPKKESVKEEPKKESVKEEPKKESVKEEVDR